jgi:hypothetical protein
LSWLLRSWGRESDTNSRFAATAAGFASQCCFTDAPHVPTPRTAVCKATEGLRDACRNHWQALVDRTGRGIVAFGSSQWKKSILEVESALPESVHLEK